MITRPALLLLSLPPLALSAFDCKFDISSRQFDLTGLPPTVISFDESTPPTRTNTTLYIQPCQPIEDGQPGRENEVDDADRCPLGSTVCMREKNVKREKESGDGQEKDVERVTKVVKWAGSEGSVRKGKGKTDVVVTLTGGTYNSRPLTTSIFFICTLDASQEQQPTIKRIRYSDLELDKNQEGELELEWITRAGCDTNKLGRHDGGGPQRSGGWGFGTFLLFVILLLIVYFAIGIYYNHTNLGAQGWDLIPHRDFWRDLPYLIKDIFTRGSNGRSGYSSI